MTAQLVLCRNMVLDAINAYQLAPGFAYNGFAAAASYIPFQKIEDPNTKAGKVWVIAAYTTEYDRKTRNDPSGNTPPLVKRDLAVQVAYQQSDINPSDIPTLDALLLTQEQLRDAVKNYNYTQPVTPSFAPLWVRNEVLKDESGVPFHYYMLREATVFENYFTAFFTIPHQ